MLIYKQKKMYLLNSEMLVPAILFCKTELYYLANIYYMLRRMLLDTAIGSIVNDIMQMETTSEIMYANKSMYIK